MSFTVHLAKENFKFSSTHFTIFSKEKAERLHGHNYQVKCDIELSDLDPAIGMAFDFNLVKPEIKAICDEVDEYILIASKSPYLTFKHLGELIEMQFANKRYLFPKEDCRELPLVNITSEELARYFCEKLWVKISHLRLASLQISIEETSGQSVSFKKSIARRESGQQP